MRIILLGILLIPAALSAQQKQHKGFVSLEPSIHFYKKAEPAFGFQLSGNGQLGSGLYAGVEVGVVRLAKDSGIYIPFQAKFSVIPIRNKYSPMVLIEPGYGVYKSKASSSAEGTAGGFTFFGGVGLAFPGKDKSRGFLAVGYSRFGFETGSTHTSIEGVGIKLALMLL
jgi:hypothetical protein